MAITLVPTGDPIPGASTEVKKKRQRGEGADRNPKKKREAAKAAAAKVAKEAAAAAAGAVGGAVGGTGGGEGVETAK